MAGAAFRIHRLRIEGFKAFAAPQSFEMDGGHVFVFGMNGLGKSSVVEAVRWCLFGAAGRPDAEFRNVFYSAGECKVELDLEGRGGRWRVQRRLRPGARESELIIQDPSRTTVPRVDVFPGLASLGPREGTHIIFASQQSTRRRPQADITDFDKVLYSYLRIESVPDLLDRLEREIEEQAEIEQQLAEEVNDAEESLRSALNDLRQRMEENLAAAAWPGETVPTSAETDARIRAFVEDCGGSLERTDGGTVTREWLLAEAERAIQQVSEATQDTVQSQLNDARATLQQLVIAKGTFEHLTEQFETAQAQVRSCEYDLRKALDDTTTQQLLTEHSELEQQNEQLTQHLALMQQAAGYVERFSPEECPMCDAVVDPADLLPQIRGRIGSDPRMAELAEALARVGARLEAIRVEEANLATARTTCASVESGVEAARAQIEGLLDTPGDLSSIDHVVKHLENQIGQFELELRESGSLVATKRHALKDLHAEVRFQEYRSREERLRHNLESGLEPAREAHREFADVLETLRTIREALQESFNDTLDKTKPQIDALMTEVYGRLTQQASFPKVVVQSGPADKPRTLSVRVTSDRTPGETFDPYEVLNGQASNAVDLLPYFVFSQFQAEALELDCLLIDDPSQSFDTSRVDLLLQELATAATHAQIIVASHEEDRFAPFINKYFPAGSYRKLRVTSFAPDSGPTLACAD
ncbi:MAG: AAA family ATPase [Chloroflexi bacterium]|nr:AAA family ATPase [Chloroflexota bacterium]